MKTPEIATQIEVFNEAVNGRLDDANFQFADDITGLHLLDDLDDDNGAAPADANIPTGRNTGT
jgi:hypothetical protein